MTILSFCRRKKTNRAAHVDASNGAAASSPSSLAQAEIIRHFGLKDPNCRQADLDVSRKGNDTLHSLGIVDAGSTLPSLSSQSCPSSPNTAPLLLATKTCATLPVTLAASSTTSPPASSTFPTRTCHACRRPILRSEDFINLSARNQEEQRFYHTDCFTCAHCQASIDPRCQKFCCAKLSEWNGKKKRTMKKTSIQSESSRDGDHDDGDEEERPLHQECFSRHFGYMCVVCDKPLPLVTTFSEIKGGDQLQNDKVDEKSWKYTTVKFIKHPYFDTERMCPHHEQASPFFGIPRDADPDGAIDDVSHHTHTTTSEETKIGSVRRCAGCHRFEPAFASPSKHFIDVGDSDTGRCVCLACVSTVVMTSEDVVPLWDKVVNFFEGPLGLITPNESRAGCGGVTRRELMNIPILLVGMEAMNENVKHRPSGAHDPSCAATRGMCVSERIRPRGLGGGGGGKGFGVTAILCLSGLPADLTASILAHEAFHAWIKLHPNFSHTAPLPRRVEEGLAQLVAFLFLDGMETIDTDNYINERGQQGPRGGDIGGDPRNLSEEEDDSGTPSEARLRQYFKFCIEIDESVYGQGFRAAALAYAKLGIHELLYYVALNRDFPPM